MRACNVFFAAVILFLSACVSHDQYSVGSAPPQTVGSPMEEPARIMPGGVGRVKEVPALESKAIATLGSLQEKKLRPGENFPDEKKSPESELRIGGVGGSISRNKDLAPPAPAPQASEKITAVEEVEFGMVPPAGAGRQTGRTPASVNIGNSIDRSEEEASRVLTTGRSESSSNRQGSSEYNADAEIVARREAYFKQLKQASYTFNPPSPIKVATPVTVHFWLDPVTAPGRLAEELKNELQKIRPVEAPQIESGRMEWSPKMRATLTGNDFDIIPAEEKNFDGLKTLSSSRRTKWSWDIKAKHVGENLPLHLKVWVVLPQELGEPYEILKLDKHIHVDVTLFWLIDNFWEKYWKWILGGLGSAIAGAIGTWWKSRKAEGEVPKI